MGLLSGIGTALGLNKGDVYQQDPMQYADLYDKALNTLQNQNQGTGAQRAAIQSAMDGQLSDLSNNAAGLKAQFADDNARSFAADQTAMARARGGTGSLLNAQRASASAYDAQARGTQAGYNNLYQTASNNLGKLQGMQANLYGQDAQQAGSIANTYQGELAARRGIVAGNNDAQNSATQAQSARLGGTLNQAFKYLSGNLSKGMGAASGGAP